LSANSDTKHTGSEGAEHHGKRREGSTISNVGPEVAGPNAWLGLDLLR